MTPEPIRAGTRPLPSEAELQLEVLLLVEPALAVPRQLLSEVWASELWVELQLALSLLLVVSEPALAVPQQLLVRDSEPLLPPWLLMVPPEAALPPDAGLPPPLRLLPQGETGLAAAEEGWATEAGEAAEAEAAEEGETARGGGANIAH